MVTRKERREREKDTNYLFEFIKIQRHFFKDFQNYLNKVKDPRHRSYITYDPSLLLFMLILKNCTSLQSMRSLSNRFNKEECIQNVTKILNIKGLEELPHYDTINNFLEKLDVSELEKIRNHMIKELLKKRAFENYRIEGRYWGIIFDGTGLFSFDEKHCDHCLKRVYKDKETGETNTKYFHHVLEAKLVVGDMVFSIGSEFIENESEDVTKQDCELKAFHRLAQKIKHTYKRLPICILGDSLYACESVFKRCQKYKWSYIFRFKDGRIKSVASEFQALKEIEVDRQEGIYWSNDIAYKELTVNVLESEVISDNEQKKRYVFITNIKVTKKNAARLITNGRSRWKIENEGFNHQKNIRYHIEHPNSHDYTAMKNHYVLTQIADIIVQLFERGCKVLKEFKKTAKEISSLLLEAIRSRTITDEDIENLGKPIQVRFT